MAQEKGKAIEKGQQAEPRVPAVEDELSPADLEKVAGGFSHHAGDSCTTCPPHPQL